MAWDTAEPFLGTFLWGQSVPECKLMFQLETKLLLMTLCNAGF